MATEQEYDEIIAPMLAEVANRCGDLGMSIIARVEWQPDEAGITHMGIGPESGICQRLTQLAALSRGNLDALFIECARRFDLSQTVVGSFMRGKTDV